MISKKTAHAVAVTLLFAVHTAHAVTVAGQVVGDTGEPLRSIRLTLIQVSLADCCYDANMETSFDGSFQFDAPPAVYVIPPEAPTPFYPRPLRVDARRGDQRAIRLQLVLQGEELQMPEQKPAPPRRRVAR